MNKRQLRIGKLPVFILAVLILFVTSAGSVPAQDEQEAGSAFSELIIRLKGEGVIPDVNGSFLQMGSYEDTFANMGSFLGIPLFESERFVISSDISWLSASRSLDSNSAGCGFFFDKDEENKHRRMVSIRMNGRIYFTGEDNYNPLTYGNNYYTNPSIEGKDNLLIIHDGNSVTVFLNGDRVMQRNELPAWGSIAGLMILSGTNQDFGTRCTFDNLNLYTWENKE